MNIKRQNLLPNRAFFSVQTLSMERALDNVVYSSHAAGAELEREGLASAGDGVADGQTGGLLVHLDGRAVSSRRMISPTRSPLPSAPIVLFAASSVSVGRLPILIVTRASLPDAIQRRY